MPDTLKGLKALLSVSMYRKMWFPDRFYKDYLKVMFTNRKERMELLQGLITSNTDAKIPVFQQVPSRLYFGYFNSIELVCIKMN
jgi:hypothetical protein